MIMVCKYFGKVTYLQQSIFDPSDGESRVVLLPLVDAILHQDPIASLQSR